MASGQPASIRGDPAPNNARKSNTEIPKILPHERVFSIQIGTELFRLSGASISSDVPRLVSQLYEEDIFISIGGLDFQIPRRLFSDPGNSPNYFSLGFAVFFATPSEVFPGLNRENLIRPPSIMPPSVPNRSAEIFAQLLHLLRGYPLHIKDEDHRAELLRDCKYFHLKGLEQKLLRHSICFNLYRNRHEITLRLEDVRQSGISVVIDPSSPPPLESNVPSYSPPQGFVGHVNYARPFVDDRAYELVLEIGDECTRLHLSSMRCEFFGDGKARMTKLLAVVAVKLQSLNIQPLVLAKENGGATSRPIFPGDPPVGEDWVRCVLGEEASVRLDGRDWHHHGQLSEPGHGSVGSTTASPVVEPDDAHGESTRKRRRTDGSSPGSGLESRTWVVKRGQWRLRVQNAKNGKGRLECVLVAVNLDALASEEARNSQRGFLAG